MTLKKNALMWTAVLAGVLVLLAGGMYLATRKLAPIAAPQQVQGTYALTDVNRASTTAECWVAIDGGVYDLTSYAQNDARLVTLCGTDASEAVAKMGSGFAENFDNLRIGTLQ